MATAEVITKRTMVVGNKYTFRVANSTTAFEFEGVIVSVAPAVMGAYKGLLAYQVDVGNVRIPRDTAFEVI